MVEKEPDIELSARWVVYCENCKRELWAEDDPNGVQMIIAKKLIVEHSTQRHHKVVFVNFPYIN